MQTLQPTVGFEGQPYRGLCFDYYITTSGAPHNAGRTHAHIFRPYGSWHMKHAHEAIKRPRTR